MIVTPENARRLLAKYYPGNSFRLTTKLQVGVRPIFETQIGLKTLVWQKLTTGNSAVRLGILLGTDTSLPIDAQILWSDFE